MAMQTTLLNYVPVRSPGSQLKYDGTLSQWCDLILESYAKQPNGFGKVDGTLLSSGSPVKVRRAFLGQYGQDWALFSAVFQNATNGDGHKRVYVDLAAAFNTDISNTFFYDACLGWEGVCIEADPSKAQGLIGSRGCVVVNTCVHHTDGAELLINPGAHDGASYTATPGQRGYYPQKHTHALKCTTLERVLAETSTTHVDFLSLDAEGAELYALQGTDFTKVRIEMILLEVEHFITFTAEYNAKGKEFAAFFEREGYVPVVWFPMKWSPEAPQLLHNISQGLTGAEKSGQRSKTKDVLWVKADSPYLPRIKEWIADWESGANPN